MTEFVRSTYRLQNNHVKEENLRYTLYGKYINVIRIEFSNILYILKKGAAQDIYISLFRQQIKNVEVKFESNDRGNVLIA